MVQIPENDGDARHHIWAGGRSQMNWAGFGSPKR
jgi:hypothetical protein